uniref:Uncharacterized protein n=1 Tax=Pyrodinium bahamense TaxID=73915 RepID=A0A7S0BEA8_9DINO|mmetsp:Transcript_9339/g.26276  ORF Transcript_9339/g.26276 Transcript_9339/m.26276 type:complete len:185 (+) Transcript_9339:138-692(+)
MELLRAFCSSEACGGRRRAASSATGRHPSKPEEVQSRGSLFGHVSLRPSVVDDGELLFPPRAQGRQAPPRGSSAPRQRGAGSRLPRSPPSYYTGADFLDYSPNGSSLQPTPGSPCRAYGSGSGAAAPLAAPRAASRPLTLEPTPRLPSAASPALQRGLEPQRNEPSLNLEGCGAVSDLAQSLRR